MRNPAQCFDYFSFTATEAGTYYFTSESDNDTDAYLYSDAEMSEELEYSDDDNGSQFKFEHYMEAGETVYLLPRGYGGYSSCDFTVTVTDYDPSDSSDY